jgi:hypothetical protein
MYARSGCWVGPWKGVASALGAPKLRSMLLAMADGFSSFRAVLSATFLGAASGDADVRATGLPSTGRPLVEEGLGTFLLGSCTVGSD